MENRDEHTSLLHQSINTPRVMHFMVHFSRKGSQVRPTTTLGHAFILNIWLRLNFLKVKNTLAYGTKAHLGAGELGLQP